MRWAPARPPAIPDRHPQASASSAEACRFRPGNFGDFGEGRPTPIAFQMAERDPGSTQAQTVARSLSSGQTDTPGDPQKHLSGGRFLSIVRWTATPAFEARNGASAAAQKPIARARMTPTQRLVAATRNCWNNLCFCCCDTARFSWTPLRSPRSGTCAFLAAKASISGPLREILAHAGSANEQRPPLRGRCPDGHCLDTPR